MNFRKPNIDPLEINLMPMIDCLLFLIVFLLMSTTFNKYSRLNLMLPEATGVPEAKKASRIEITIDKEGDYAIDGHAIGSAEKAELSASLREVVNQKGVVPVIIAADGNASHQSVVRVMDAAGHLGLVNINISTKVPNGERH